METDSFSRPKFRKDDLVPLCDSCTMICALDRRTELQTVNRLSRVDFQGQVMRIGDGLDAPTPLVTGAPEASKDFKARSPDSRRQLMEDCFFGRRFAGGWRPSPPDGPTPLALHAQPRSLPFYRGAYRVSGRDTTPGPSARPFVALQHIVDLDRGWAGTGQRLQGAKVYIAPMNGFEDFLEAAIIHKHVPVTKLLSQNSRSCGNCDSFRLLQGRGACRHRVGWERHCPKALA